MIPVVAVVVQLVWVLAVLVSADIRAEIVNEVDPVSCISFVLILVPHKVLPTSTT